MSEAAVARVYAEALLESARDAGRLDAVAGEIEDVARALRENEMLRNALGSPRLRAEVKREIVDACIAGASPETVRFLHVLVDRGRFEAIEAIAARLRARIDEVAGRVRVEAVGAHPLAKAEIRRIEKAVRARHKDASEVSVNARVDPALLGGLVIREGDRVFDGSVHSRLAELHRRLRAVQPPASLWEGEEMDEAVQAVRAKAAELPDEKREDTRP